jgi:hypothetical protein
MRTARSRSSGENLGDFLIMAPFSKKLEPPQNPGRFTVDFFQWKGFYMKKSRYSDSQIMETLKRVDAGLGVPRMADAPIADSHVPPCIRV